MSRNFRQLLPLFVLLTAISATKSGGAQTPAEVPDSQAKPPSLPVTGQNPPRVDAATAKQFELPETKPYIDLTHRYRFTELYTKNEERVSPGMVGQYLVGMVETLRESIKVPQGKPKESEITRQTIFMERPAEVSSLGVARATIRKYTRFLIHPESTKPISGPPPLDGLTVYYRGRQGEPPEIINIGQDRRLHEREYELASHQIFMPSLPGIFPAYPARIGDSWRVPKRTVQALLGEPSLRGDSLVAKFAELRQVESTKKLIAVFSITGRVANEIAETAINTRIEFTFDLPVAPEKPGIPGAEAPAASKDVTPATAATGKPRTPTPLKPGDQFVVDAKGAITELRLARVATGFLPYSAQKQKYTASQELILRRKLGVEASGGVLLKLLEAPPLNDVNSWITFTDPNNRFTFQHPQDLLPPERFQLSAAASDDSVDLRKTRPDGNEMIRINVFQKSMEPETLQDVLNAEWKRSKAEVLPGPSEWLPETSFPKPTRVFRIEASLKLGGRGSRLHYDAYLVNLSETASFMVIATTSRDATDDFRKTVEHLIQTFQMAPAAIR